MPQRSCIPVFDTATQLLVASSNIYQRHAANTCRNLAVWQHRFVSWGRLSLWTVLPLSSTISESIKKTNRDELEYQQLGFTNLSINAENKIKKVCITCYKCCSTRLIFTINAATDLCSKHLQNVDTGHKYDILPYFIGEARFFQARWH